MMKEIKLFFNHVRAAVDSIYSLFGKENVLEVHNCDLVNNPRGTLSRIFQFLDVEASDHYLDVCVAKVFQSVFQSRDTVEWKPKFREIVQARMMMYPVFD